MLMGCQSSIVPTGVASSNSSPRSNTSSPELSATQTTPDVPFTPESPIRAQKLPGLTSSASMHVSQDIQSTEALYGHPDQTLPIQTIQVESTNTCDTVHHVPSEPTRATLETQPLDSSTRVSAENVVPEYSPAVDEATRQLSYHLSISKPKDHRKQLALDPHYHFAVNVLVIPLLTHRLPAQVRSLLFNGIDISRCIHAMAENIPMLQLNYIINPPSLERCYLDTTSMFWVLTLQ